MTLLRSGRLPSAVVSGVRGEINMGEIVESRDATLDEILLARASRSRQRVEAA